MLGLGFAVAVFGKSIDLVAHRGLPGVYPEETLTGYKLAAPHADYLECDVVVSKSQKLYCSHEPVFSTFNSDIVGTSSDIISNRIRSEAMAKFDTGEISIEGVFFNDLSDEDISSIPIQHRFLERDEAHALGESAISFSDFLTLAVSMRKNVYVEPKHSSWYQSRLGVNLGELLLNAICSHPAFPQYCSLQTASDEELEELGNARHSLPESITVWDRKSVNFVLNRIVKSRRILKHGHQPAPIKVVLQSFEWDDMLYFNYMGWSEKMSTCLLTEYTSEAKYGAAHVRRRDNGIELDLRQIPLPRLIDANVSVIGMDKRILLASDTATASISALHSLGVKALVWTIRSNPSNVLARGTRATVVHTKPEFNGNVFEELATLMQIGIDGIFTDDVHMIAPVLRLSALADSCNDSQFNLSRHSYGDL